MPNLISSCQTKRNQLQLLIYQLIKSNLDHISIVSFQKIIVHNRTKFSDNEHFALRSEYQILFLPLLSFAIF